MLRSNLTYLGMRRQPQLRSYQVAQWNRPSEKLRPLAEKIVKKALFNQLSQEDAYKVINGYRRSASDDEAAKADFLRTDVPYHDLPRDKHYRRALRVVERLFRPSRVLHPISVPDLRYFPWKLNVSAEAPFTAKKRWIDYVRNKQSEGLIDDSRMSFHNLYNEVFNINRPLIHRMKEGAKPFWKDGEPVPYEYTTLHSRAHLVAAEKEDKIRAVFGVPKLLLMVENMFIWNLQKEYLNGKVKSPMMWGFETIRGGWRKIYIRNEGRRHSYHISTDWSGFDRFALHEVIDDVHDMWRRWFDFSTYEPTNHYPNPTVKEERVQRIWDWMCNAIKHTPIRTHDGELYRWEFSGIMSGFQQTQLLDSFVNCIMILTCLSEMGINIEGSDFDIWVQGDDSLVCFPERIPQPRLFLTKFANIAKIRFNAEMSPDKTSHGPNLSDVEVLSYRNTAPGYAYRSKHELLAHLLYPERPRTLDQLASSAVGIARASMGCSRDVYNVCKDVFDFLTEKMGRIPVPDDSDVWVTKKFSPFTTVTFPSWEETFLQNLDLQTRTEREKQLLWPTELTAVTDENPKGFQFLNS